MADKRNKRKAKTQSNELPKRLSSRIAKQRNTLAIPKDLELTKNVENPGISSIILWCNTKKFPKNKFLQWQAKEMRVLSL